MKLNEIAGPKGNRVAPWEWEHWHTTEVRATFDIGEHPYEVIFETFKYLDEDETIWQVEFGMQGGDLTLSGTGQAHLVLSTVMDIIGDFVRQEKPAVLIMESSIEEPSRMRLYKRAIPGLASKLGMKLEMLYKGTLFALIRPDIDSNNVNQALKR